MRGCALSAYLPRSGHNSMLIRYIYEFWKFFVFTFELALLLIFFCHSLRTGCQPTPSSRIISLNAQHHASVSQEFLESLCDRIVVLVTTKVLVTINYSLSRNLVCDDCIIATISNAFDNDIGSRSWCRKSEMVVICCRRE
jgi:hypothetical protein